MRGNSMYTASGRKVQLGLQNAARMWPTPAAADAERASKTYMRGNPTLLGAALSFPSPSARDWRSGKGRQDNGHSPQLPEVIGGQLNPTWVEWLMGFPPGWTDLGDSATP
jgi:hypothetical protein